MQDQAVIETQLEFYRRGDAGCLFAAHAAGDPAKYEWRLSVAKVDTTEIASLVASAIVTPGISTQSIIFPSIVSEDDFLDLLRVLGGSEPFFLGQTEKFKGAMCLGYRVKMGEGVSWLTGFGGFDFFPKTRQAVFVEIVFRSKPRPHYTKVMKEAPMGVLHLADMNMKGMGKNKFMALWYGSFDKTESLLGHKPDLRSAAKTTFAIPLRLWKRL